MGPRGGQFLAEGRVMQGPGAGAPLVCLESLGLSEGKQRAGTRTEAPGSPGHGAPEAAMSQRVGTLEQ